MQFLPDPGERDLGSLHDPIERRLAPLLNLLLISLIIAIIPTAIIFLTALGWGSGGVIVIGQGITAASALGALLFLRRGRFQLAILLMVGGLLLSLGIVFVLLGFQASVPFFLVFVLPLSLTALFAGPRATTLVVVLSILLVSGIALADYLGLPLVGQVSLPADLAIPAIATFAGAMPVIGFLLARFGSSLRAALLASMLREQELTGLSGALEQAVSERTAELQAALQAVQQRETRLAQTLDELQTSQQVIQDLNAPIVPLLPGVLVAPLVGLLDTRRVSQLTDNILRAVEDQRGRYVILDITGVPLVDTQVAGQLINTANAVRLLGAQVWMVGIRPEVAQAMVTLGIELDMIETHPNLQEAVAILLANYSIQEHKG